MGFQNGAVGVAMPGDANLDGRVDINDLSIVLVHYNQTGMPWAQGEFTGSGTVDINDLSIVLAHYNQTLGSSVAAAAAVPEPSTLLLVLVGLLLLLRPVSTVQAADAGVSCALAATGKRGWTGSECRERG